MDKHEAAMQRGEEASRILNSELFTRAFEDVRTALLKQWEQMPVGDTEDAQDIHRRLKCLQQVKTALVEHIRTGRMAEKELSAMEKARRAVSGAIHRMNPLAQANRNR